MLILKLKFLGNFCWLSKITSNSLTVLFNKFLRGKKFIELE